MSKKINFINLAKISTKDYDKIKELPLNLIFRYTLKLIRTYPSIKRDEMRENIILDYKDGKYLQDQEKILEAVYQARGFLHHLLTYELVMRQFGRDDTNKFEFKVDMLPNIMGVEKGSKNKNKEEDYEYF